MITEFFKEFLFEIIFTIVLTSGVVTFHLTKLRKMINTKNVGINRVYKKGKDIKGMIKTIEKSNQVKMIAFMPYNFVFTHKSLLIQKVKDGCNIKILIGNEDSQLLKELCQIERGVEDDIAKEFVPLINLLKSIKNSAGDEATGTIEVRTYNTEIRNPGIICTREDGRKTAFLTVSLPPKRSIDSLMLEYKDNDCDPVIDYFKEIWDKHENDVALFLR